MTHMSTRRSFLSVAAALTATTVPLRGQAQGDSSSQNKLVRAIVGTAAGSTPDVIMRVIQDRVSEALSKTIIVENRLGAAGQIATEYVANQATDGRTILVASTSMMITTPLLNPAVKYSYGKNIIPIVGLGSVGYVVVTGTGPGTPKTLNELFDQLRKSSGSYSSYGVGAFGQLGAEMLMERAGVKALHVPYKSAAMNDLIAGLNTFAVTTVSEAVPLVASGRLRALAVASPTRMVSLPTVPTVAESSSGKIDLSNFSLEVWYGLFAPAKTSQTFISTLSNVVIDALKRSEVQTKLAAASVVVTPLPTAVFAKQVDADFSFWQETLKRLQASGRLS